MARAPKSFEVLKSEGRSHYSKRQLKIRQEAEKSLSSGSALKEWPDVKNNPVAHKEFMRINKLLTKVDRNDAMFEAVINRYCLLQSECSELEQQRDNLFKDVEELEGIRAEMLPAEFYKLKLAL